jgi:hypothetical protein
MGCTDFRDIDRCRLQSSPSNGLERVGLEIILDRFLLYLLVWDMRDNDNHLCSCHPCTVDRIDSSPRSSGNIGYI